MLDIQLLRKDLPTVVAALKRRHFDFDEATFRTLEEERRKLQSRTEELRSRSFRLVCEAKKLSDAASSLADFDRDHRRLKREYADVLASKDAAAHLGLVKTLLSNARAALKEAD